MCPPQTTGERLRASIVEGIGFAIGAAVVAGIVYLLRGRR